jgi:hypothetical protein
MAEGDGIRKGELAREILPAGNDILPHFDSGSLEKIFGFVAVLSDQVKVIKKAGKSPSSETPRRIAYAGGFWK